MMFKLLLSLTVLMLTACAHSNMQSIPASVSNTTVNKNVAQPVASPTVQTSLSECSQKRAVGLSSGVNIPQELCFDDLKPADAKEKSNAKVGNSPQSSLIAGTEIPFADLPKEVQNMVRLTAPKMDASAVVFDLTIIPTPDAKAANKLIKSYSYGSSSKNKAPGKDPNHHSWLFKRQDNLLKLEYAEIDTTK